MTPTAVLRTLSALRSTSLNRSQIVKYIGDLGVYWPMNMCTPYRGIGSHDV